MKIHRLSAPKTITLDLHVPAAFLAVARRFGLPPEILAEMILRDASAWPARELVIQRGGKSQDRGRSGPRGGRA